MCFNCQNFFHRILPYHQVIKDMYISPWRIYLKFSMGLILMIHTFRWEIRIRVHFQCINYLDLVNPFNPHKFNLSAPNRHIWGVRLHQQQLKLQIIWVHQWLTNILLHPSSKHQTSTESHIQGADNFNPAVSKLSIFQWNVFKTGNPKLSQHTPLSASSPIYKHGLTLIPAWMSKHMLSKMWD